MEWLFFIALAIGTENVGGTEVKLIDPRTGDLVSINQVADSLCGSYDVIYFGEHHDYWKSHKAELELLKALHERCDSIAVAMEMFERDVQSVLDRYLAGEITEEAFLASSRPWPNYKTDYRPIIEFAKANNIPVIAANVPTRIARSVAHNGRNILDSLSEAERRWIADTVFYDSKEYRKNFFETMQSIGHTGDIASEDVLQRFYEAQCLKDATMAESIVRFLDKHPNYMVLHINGGFHSDYHLGIPYQLKKLRPDLRIAVIATISPEEIDSGVGDYLLIDDRKAKPQFKLKNAPKEKTEKN